MAQVDDLDSIYVEAEALGAFLDHLLVAEQDGDAQTVGSRDGGGAEHIVGIGLAEGHSLRVGARCLVQAACKLAVVAFEQAEFFVIFVPVGDRAA